MSGSIPLGDMATIDMDSVRIRVGSEHPYAVSVEAPPGDSITATTYTLRSPMRNFTGVIPPDSGRWFMNLAAATSFWKFGRDLRSRVQDVKVPLYLFLGANRHVEIAMGVVGDLTETDCRLIEPESNRALNIHTGGVQVAFTRYHSSGAEDGVQAVTEHMYARLRASGDDGETWLDVMRDFSEQTRARFGRPDVVVPAAVEPYWCSWTDWDSADVDEELVLQNVAAGVALGVRNFILDDGWFGPGLDSSYGVPLNIGDWSPDPGRFPDLPRLITSVGELGGRLIIWCAPHAVGPASDAFRKQAALLMADADGRHLRSETQFFSLCLRSEEAREVMVDVCVRLAQTGFHGAKYDLFNWLPEEACESPDHAHDLRSPIAGLRDFLRRADDAVRAFAPDYVVELKQNYGTALLAPYGTSMRAGDAPYDLTTNLQRTLHVQGYTGLAMNDYQSFSPTDGPESKAVIVGQMMAAGIPAYGTDLAHLDDASRAVLTFYHDLYHRNLAGFARYRVPEDATCTTLRVPSANEDIVFLLENAHRCTVRRRTTVVNARYDEHVTLETYGSTVAVRVFDCTGQESSSLRLSPGIHPVRVPVGGMLHVDEDGSDA
ncbi:alpha-galactosidase [Promicromonospora sp. NPDC023805]|uniref:alpha-galactosidase n=1 Tax=Promicromonospora sp. NPDC023805 TaxID=3154696 RepID=UPI0034011586